MVDRRPPPELPIRHEIGWEIKTVNAAGWSRIRPTPASRHGFWNSCDAVADDARGSQWGTPNCGKGEPMQTGRTAQCAAPARFRNVAVGVGYLDADAREAVAARVLALSGADATEAIVRRPPRTLTRFTRNAIHQNVAIATSRSAFARSSTAAPASRRRTTCDAALDALVRARLHLGAPCAAQRDRREMVRAPPVAQPPAARSSAATAAATADERAEIARGDLRGRQPARCCGRPGFVTTAVRHHDRQHARAPQSFDGTECGANVKKNAATRPDTPNVSRPTRRPRRRGAGAVAADKASRQRRSGRVPSPASGPSSSSRPPFGELIAFLASHFSAQIYDEGSSFFSAAAWASRLAGERFDSRRRRSPVATRGGRSTARVAEATRRAVRSAASRATSSPTAVGAPNWGGPTRGTVCPSQRERTLARSSRRRPRARRPSTN